MKTHIETEITELSPLHPASIAFDTWVESSGVLTSMHKTLQALLRVAFLKGWVEGIDAIQSISSRDENTNTIYVAGNQKNH